MAILASSEIESSAWRKIAIFWVALSILFWGVTTLYLGSTFNPSFYQENIIIDVVNFDRGNSIGEEFRNITKLHIKNNPPQSILVHDDALGAKGNIQAGWNLPDSDTFLDDVDLVVDRVRKGNVWGAIVVNPGATAALNAAAAAADPNYDPRGAITIIYDEGRNPNTVAQFVVHPMRSLAQEFQASFTQTWISSLAAGNNAPTVDSNGTTTSSGGSNLQNIATNAPALLSFPVTWSEINIANTSSESAFVTFAGLTIGLLLLVIFTYAAVTIIIDITDEYNQDLSGSTMISLRLRQTFFFTITLSLFYSLAMAAFKGSFSAGTWFAFWVLHFLHLLVHALTFLTAAVIASPAVQAPIFLLILVINVTAALGTPELANQFYQWSYGMPMYAAVTGSRTLLFGGYPRLGNNFGSLIGWAVGFLIVYCFFQIKALEGDDGPPPMQRSSTIQDLEKSLTGTLRASRQFSFREDQSRGGTSVHDDNDEYRAHRRNRASVDINHDEQDHMQH